MEQTEILEFVLCSICLVVMQMGFINLFLTQLFWITASWAGE